MTVRVSDLIPQTGKPGPHPVLHCRICGEDDSANQNDYFAYPSAHVFKCCGEPVQLAVKEIVYRRVKLPQKG